MSRARIGRPHSEAHRAAISSALTGLRRSRDLIVVCRNCGTTFATAARNAKFCSVRCRRASYGHGLVHSADFSGFPRACAVCGRKTRLVGDHDHATNEPRGILCRPCNLAIGNMEDDPERLRRAALYLEDKL